MSELLKRILALSNEIENFPLGSCSPSDDPDKQTAYLFSFRELVVRFVASAKRINDESLKEMISELNVTPDCITEAYVLKAELQGIFDYINDIQTSSSPVLREKVKISELTANKLIQIIRTNLVTESANVLNKICVGYGLADGEVHEAYKSKANYVYSRTASLSPEEILELGNKMRGKYEDGALDDFLDKIYAGDNLSLISEFENIRELIKTEIQSAKFIVWIAVAWFTDTELANLLYLKSKEGVNIQIIINDDAINSEMKKKLSTYFELFLAPVNEKFKKLMHNKFCVIDLEKVIHGSYNWTNKARYNNETVSLIKNRESASQFASEFIRLKKELNQGSLSKKVTQ